MVLYPHGSEISLCEGAVLSLTCVSDTGHINWSLGGTSKTFWSVSSPFALDDSVIVTPVSESAGVFTSVATVVQAPATLNGTVLECSDGLLLGATTELVTIIVSGRSFLMLKLIIISNSFFLQIACQVFQI